MTSVEGPDDETSQHTETGQHTETDDAPGWGLPSQQPDHEAPPKIAGGDEAPLTAVQQAVVNEVAEGQRELGREMRFHRWATADLLGGGDGIVASTIDSALASSAASRVADSEREAEFLAGSMDPATDEEPHVPAGGPPTPEEVHEAEMHPWPHHGMAETIEHNRQLRQDPEASGSQDGTSQ